MEALKQAYELLAEAAALIGDGGWPGLATEVAEMANAVDAAAS
jgi:hypothetical protein